ncbi:MAG: hypothetical protein JWO97_4891, partial [Acidobacteria bacterium]|nr:hypothetical protein [Acidobacteriota bacterium]
MPVALLHVEPLSVCQTYCTPAGAATTWNVIVVLRVVVMFDGCCVIDGAGVTVTTALPDDVPPVQPESLTAVTVYVVVAAGETLRVAVVVEIPDCTTPSDQVMENGAAPMSVTVIVRAVDGQPLLFPLTVAVGFALMVIAALPVDVPLQFASVMLVIVYVVLLGGETLRVTLVVLTFDCVTPSDQMIVNGATPLSVALIVVELPAQIAALPLTTALGFALTVIAALPVDVP